MKINQTASVLALSIALAGCIPTGEDAGEGAGVIFGSQSLSVSGIAAAGLAECRVEAFALDGRSISDVYVGASSPMSAGGTPTDGSYTLQLEADHSGPFLIEATDCTYIDEASNEVISGGVMRALATVTSTGDGDTEVTVHVTPFSTLAAELAEEEAGGLENLDEDDVTAANEAISEIFFGEDVDIIRTAPIVSTEDNPDQNQQASIDYGLYLAALSGAGELRETLDELKDEIDLSDRTLSSLGEEILIEGAAVFESSGYKTVQRDSLEVVATRTMQGDPTGSAPVISVESEAFNIQVGQAFIMPNIASAQDVDGDLLNLRFRGLPEAVSQAGNGIAGVAVQSGQFPFMAVARDRAGNIASLRLFLNVEGSVPIADNSATPGTTNPGGGNGSGSGNNGGTGGTSGGGTVQPGQVGQNYAVLDTAEDAVRFLMRAGFGGTKAEVDALVGTDAADWLKAQMSMAPQDILLSVLETERSDAPRIPASPMQVENFDQMLGGDDDLRQRMQFALSQILVASDRGPQAVTAAAYRDILHRHAFGNYRDLLGDVTDSLMMGDYLTYLNNRKGSERTGRKPDQNYAREIMQLFSIGLVELNMDGTPKLDADQEPIETYDQSDIEGLARVFTGYQEQESDTSIPVGQRPSKYLPMRMVESRHSELEKTFLDTSIGAGTLGTASVELALDAIFAHPNVAPFIGRQLIQRFTASHPTPEYVERVSIAFESGTFVAPGGQVFGDGRRGNLEATLAAVLLEPTLFDDQIEPTDGKIREPMLLLAGWVHSAGIEDVNVGNEWLLRDLNSSIGQHPYRSPSVFNFYRPGYVAPGTVSGAFGLTAPELQIISGPSRDQFTTFMSRQVFDDSARYDDTVDSFTPDYSDLLPLADDPAALVDHLDLYLTGNRMSAQTRERIRLVAEIYGIRANKEALDREFIVHTAVTLAVTSPAFAVIF